MVYMQWFMVQDLGLHLVLGHEGLEYPLTIGRRGNLAAWDSGFGIYDPGFRIVEVHYSGFRV
jgi:hypothetical protein